MLPSIVLVIYLGFVIVIWPWKSMLLNLADAIGCGCLICMLAASCPAVATMTDSLADQVTHLALTFWFIGIGGNGAFLCYGAACWYKQQVGGEAYSEAKRKQRLERVHPTTKTLNYVAVELAKLPDNTLKMGMKDAEETAL